EFAGPVRWVIRQSGADITIETTRGDQSWTRTYPIDLAHKANETRDPKETTHAYWNGAPLVTEALDSISGQSVTFQASHALNAERTEMTVETLTLVHHGYELSGARNYTTTKDVFTRAK